MNDIVVLAVVLLLVASGYTAGRVHGQLGFRDGYRTGYRQGHADGAHARRGLPERAGPGQSLPADAVTVIDLDMAERADPVPPPSETRQLRTILAGALSAQRRRAAAAHRVRRVKG